MRSHLVVLAAFALYASTAVAGDYVVVGAGAKITCGEWTKERSTPRDANGNGGWYELTLTNWMQGYLSGLNMAAFLEAKKPMAAIPQPAAIHGWIDNYCRQNPLDDLQVATHKLMVELWRRPPAKM